MPITDGYLVVQGSQPGDLVLGQRTMRGDEPVTVALQVTTTECERPLHVGACEILAQDPLPMTEEIGEELIEVGIRSDDLGSGHRPRIGGTLDVARRGFSSHPPPRYGTVPIAELKGEISPSRTAQGSPSYGTTLTWAPGTGLGES